MIRLRAIGRGFQCPGYKFGETWQGYALNDALRDLLLRHAGLHVRVHPDDMPMLLTVGLSCETGAVSPVVAKPIADIVVESAITVVGTAIELASKAVLPRHDDKPRGKARKF